MTTKQKIQELQSKCRDVMFDHLESKGYPTMTRREIFNELIPMWKKLDEKGLVDEVKALGGSYKQFENLAIRVAQESAIMEKLRKVKTIFKGKK